ncbi:MAG: caspase family protein, partial [Pseudomonadota bacterium]
MLLATTALPALAAGDVAANRTALVIGNEAYADARVDSAAADAIAVSQTLFGLGFDVTRLENATAADLAPDRIDGALSGQTVVIFGSGRFSTTEDGALTLDPISGAAVRVDDVVAHALERGAAQVFVMLDTCATGAEGTPEALPARPGLFEIRPTEPGTACAPDDDGAPFIEAVLSRILVQGTDVEESFAPAALEGSTVWAASHLTQPFFFRKTVGTERALTPADLDMLAGLTPQKRDQMMRVWRRGGLLGGGDQGSTVVSTTRVQPVISDRVTAGDRSRVFITPAA